MLAKKNKNKDELSHIEDDTFAKGKKAKISFDDEVIRVFDPILDSDEKIEKAYKPDKTKVYFTNVLSLGIPFFVLAVFIVFVFCLPVDERATNAEIVLAIVLPSVLFALSLVLVLIVSHLYHKNTFFAYTNKRLIIRTGIFGVDYKSVDLENVSANNIVESVLDKMLKKGTGTIKFIVLAEAMSMENRQFAFSHIKNPYEVCKEIKEKIDLVKDKK